MFVTNPKGRLASPETDPFLPRLAGVARDHGRTGTHLHPFVEDGPMFDPFSPPGPRGPHERRLATWALMIGETGHVPFHGQDRRRPHRGMLPDVDFSRVVAAPRKPSLLRRLVLLFRPRAARGETGDGLVREDEAGSPQDMRPLPCLEPEEGGHADAPWLRAA